MFIIATYHSIFLFFLQLWSIGVVFQNIKVLGCFIILYLVIDVIFLTTEKIYDNY